MKIKEGYTDLGFFARVGENDREKQESLYNAIRMHIESNGFNVSSKRIYSIEFEYNNNIQVETVGQISASNNETIFAIFEADEGSMYYTCTDRRGVLGGDPMMMSGIFKVIYFRDNSSSRRSE